MLDAKNTVLVLIDIQARLAVAMHEKEKLVENLEKLIKGAGVLELPVILTEQNPDGLGETVPEIKNLLPDINPVPKFSFSCCDDEGFTRALKATGRNQVLIAGIEAHVCVYQTAMKLKAAGYDAQVVVDATSSRTDDNKRIGLDKLRHEGIALTGVETALFELLKVAGGEKFKKILKIVK